MSKEELYDRILGKDIVITGGTNGLGFSANGNVKNIIGNMIMIDNIMVVLSSEYVNIDNNENHFHVNINNDIFRLHNLFSPFKIWSIFKS